MSNSVGAAISCERSKCARVVRCGVILSIRVRRLPRFALVGATIVVVSSLLGACMLTEGSQRGETPPDAFDRIRLADLLPHFPKRVEAVSTGSGSEVRPIVAYGDTTQPDARAQATAREGDGFALNFENTPVTAVAKVILGDILGVGYTIDPRAQGTVTLSSGRPIPKKEILFVLENALRTSNLVLIHDAAAYRIMPASEAAGSGGLDVASGGKSPEPGYGVTAIPLQHVSVQTISKLLEGFATKAGTIRADPTGNMLLVTGNGDERRSAVETILSFDADWMRGQSVGIYPVHNSTPEPLLAELEKIMDSAEGGFGQNLVKFQAVSRLNAIMVVARKPELLRTAASWISRLDTSATAATGVKVYKVRYGEARQIARLLTNIFVGGSSGSLDTPANQLAPAAGTTTLSAADRLSGGGQSQAQAGTAGRSAQPAAGGADTGANDLAAAQSGTRGGAGQEGPAILPGVRITPDIVNNAILIYANQENYRIIERALNQLDRPQLQVAIELTIAEVTLNDNLNYGVQFFLQSKDIGLNRDKGSLINAGAASAILGQALPGSNLLIGSQLQPNLVINALHGYTDVKVLSNPSLVVVDNQPATLQVGDQVPVTTGSATVLSTSNTVVNTVDYKNTGIILRVQPRINSNGNVLLDVEQEISNVANNNATGTLTPTLSQRKVKSSILVASGQTVLLAGLISENQNRGRSGIPVLDRLPYVGDAFTQNTNSNVRTELIIFIRPQIIRDGVDAAFVAEELRSKMRGGKVGSIEPPGAVVPSAPRVVR
ncbi:general secretion pathway protein D [Rhizobiales bacterium GAS188]|nr:general secretion pathway protein D [Rhizobiales bacterium GAS188]